MCILIFSLVQVNQPFGQGHLDAFGSEVESAQVGFGEGDEDFSPCSADDEERRGTGGAVDVFDDSDFDRRGAGDIDERAADKIADVGFVFAEWRSLFARDGDGEPFEGFGRGDGIDGGKVKDDAALVQPVVDELDFARIGRGFRIPGPKIGTWGTLDLSLVLGAWFSCEVIGGEEPEAAAFGEFFGEIGEEIGEDFAFAALRAAYTRESDPAG
jgi:hypothetical protein